MDSVLLATFTHFGDTSAAISAMRDYVTPTIRTLAALASIACVFFLVNGGYQYMTSTGSQIHSNTQNGSFAMHSLGLS